MFNSFISFLQVSKTNNKNMELKYNAFNCQIMKHTTLTYKIEQNNKLKNFYLYSNFDIFLQFLS